MDFAYTPEQETLRQEVQAFIAEHVTDDVLGELETAEEGGRGEHYRELVRKVAERNWIGISWPKEYGGQGGSRIEQYIVGGRVRPCRRGRRRGGQRRPGHPGRRHRGSRSRNSSRE